ncbi:MAG: DegT/DnrJ/EryC1/StrS family aminotransferase [Candidatus Kerfeldbacteria bacterium]|nr:DegT/DnrJ/EryC1/StrS family aminotransferase [Candidatus Kerfeldbacteria bacterium]
MNVPVNSPFISVEAKRNVAEAMDTGWISSAGKFVEEFERDFASYLGMKHGITVSNGTAALHVALLAVDIGPDDEVIVPAFTMMSTILAVLYTGAKPVFVDCELETYNIDVKQIEAHITSRTKAILPVHIYGHACEMDEILALAKQHNLHVIEDAAEAHGGEYKGKKCGTMSELSCFSFYGNKIVTTGEGGMVLTNDDALAHRCRKLKDLYHSDAKRFIHEQVGYNYRLTNVQAAIGCGEIKHIEEYIAKKQWMADFYREHLSVIPGLRLPVTKSYVKNVYWMYGVLVDPDKFGMDKDTLRARLKERGVDTRDFFYSPNVQPVLLERFGKMGDFPNTDYIAANGLYLPSGLALTEEQARYVCEQVKQLAPAA